MDVIFLDSRNQKHEGIIIHQEKEYFGAYIFSMKELIVGNPERNITKDEETQVIFSYDHRHHLDKLFNSSGECDSYIFEYFKNPEPIIKYLKMIKIIMP